MNTNQILIRYKKRSKMNANQILIRYQKRSKMNTKVWQEKPLSFTKEEVTSYAWIVTSKTVICG